MNYITEITQALIRATEQKMVEWNRRSILGLVYYSALLERTEIRVTREDENREVTFDLTAVDDDGLVGTLKPGDPQERGLVSQLFQAAEDRFAEMERKQAELLKLIERKAGGPNQAVHTNPNRPNSQRLEERPCTCACCADDHCDPSCAACMCICNNDCPKKPCNPECLHDDCSPKQTQRYSNLLTETEQRQKPQPDRD